MANTDGTRYILNTDGGIVAAANQAEGEAAIGAVITRDGELWAKASARIGWCRNHHVAEYKALIIGLRLAEQMGLQDFEVRIDSELVHRTVKGEWNLKPKHLQELRDQAMELRANLGFPNISWVPRRENKEADLLAGELLKPLRKPPPIGDDLVDRN